VKPSEDRELSSGFCGFAETDNGHPWKVLRDELSSQMFLQKKQKTIFKDRFKKKKNKILETQNKNSTKIQQKFKIQKNPRPPLFTSVMTRIPFAPIVAAMTTALTAIASPSVLAMLGKREGEGSKCGCCSVALMMDLIIATDSTGKSPLADSAESITQSAPSTCARAKGGGKRVRKMWEVRGEGRFLLFENRERNSVLFFGVDFEFLNF